jgi:hypothetical protein
MPLGSRCNSATSTRRSLSARYSPRLGTPYVPMPEGRGLLRFSGNAVRISQRVIELDNLTLVSRRGTPLIMLFLDAHEMGRLELRTEPTARSFRCDHSSPPP